MLIEGLYRMGQNWTQKNGILRNYGVVAGRIEPVKNADYSDVIMGVSGINRMRAEVRKSALVFSL